MPTFGRTTRSNKKSTPDTPSSRPLPPTSASSPSKSTRSLPLSSSPSSGFSLPHLMKSTPSYSMGSSSSLLDSHSENKQNATGSASGIRSARSSLLNVLSHRQTSNSANGPTVASAYAAQIDRDNASILSTETIPTSSSSLSSLSSGSGSESIYHLDTSARDLTSILEIPLGVSSSTGTGTGTASPHAKVAGWRHSEYGHDNNQTWRHTSQYVRDQKVYGETHPPYYILLTTYCSYLILIVFGHIRDFFGKRFSPEAFHNLRPANGYAALFSDFDSFYTRRLKLRIDDCFSRPTTGVAGRTVVCYDRVTSNYNNQFQHTGEKTRALNISSYNYLGFAQATGGCADAVEAGIRKYGVSTGGARLEAGTLDLHIQAERLCAEFLGSEDAMLISMGFATNSTTIPAMVNKGCLVISDEFNHASIRTGVRLSGAAVKMYKHNDMAALERLLRDSISQGQPRTHRPWKKILVIVEGLFSMEGTLVHLPELIVLKEKYKFYLYVDEAHSIGALGPNGRGVCDYFGVDPRSIDILMGTFTKSFGAAGGYIAGNKEVIDRLRIKSHAMAYAEGMSPPVLTQIIASMASIMGVSPPLAAPATTDPSEMQMTSYDSGTVYGPAPASILPTWMSLPPALLNGTEGRERLRRLCFNSRYLSMGLRKLGFIVYGHPDSPVIPVLIFNPGKMPAFSRMMLDRVGVDRTPIVVVVVAYPATPLIASRVRFCVSSAHTKHDIDLILRACDEVGDILDLKQGSKVRWGIEDVVQRAEELVHSV